ncbi:MAG: hypothetical protein QOF02_2330 [Blastocatellia bacterium]|jgi:hypothetical protein|nr:hypothetical protein [Blastocatellia bacterium]
MKRSALMVLMMLLSVLLEPLGPWQSRGQLSGAAQTEARREGTGSRPYQSLTVALREGSFVLRDLQLTSVGGSTKISGKLVNQTKQQWQGVMLSLKAYDASGRQLRGVERETVFGFNQLEKGKSAPINSGYGVWLEGVPLQSIARLEVGLLKDEQRDSHHRSSGNPADMEE